MPTTIPATDPGRPYGFDVDTARNFIEQARKWEDKTVHPGTLAYDILCAYSGAPGQSLTEPTMLYTFLTEMCHPAVMLSTPRPDWANQTSQSHRADGTAYCSHVKRFDTDTDTWAVCLDVTDYVRPGGTVQRDEPYVVVEWDKETSSVDELLRFAEAVKAAASLLEQLQS